MNMIKMDFHALTTQMFLYRTGRAHIFSMHDFSENYTASDS